MPHEVLGIKGGGIFGTCFYYMKTQKYISIHGVSEHIWDWPKKSGCMEYECIRVEGKTGSRETGLIGKSMYR